MFIAIKSKTGMFYDPETRLRIHGDEIKEVKHIGYLTRQRLNSGGLVIVDSPTELVEEVVVKPVVETPKEKQPVVKADEPVELKVEETTESEQVVTEPATTIIEKVNDIFTAMDQNTNSLPTPKPEPKKRGRKKKILK